MARVIETVPQKYCESITMTATIRVAGITAPMTIKGVVDGVVFKVYVKEVLSPTLAVGEVGVMDNLPAHEVSGIRRLIEACGAKLIYLLHYSPYLNPIKNC